jgi:hypothetical protein
VRYGAPGGLAVTVRHVQFVMWAAGLFVQYLVISALLRGGWKHFPLLLLYVAVLSCTTLTDIAAFFTLREKRSWALYYWSAELVRQSVLYAVIVSLGLRVLPGRTARPHLVKYAAAFAVLFYGSCLLLLYQPDMNLWMTDVVRNVSFASAVLNLAVWLYTIAAQPRDMTVLLIACGLGIQITGEAIGQSLRQLFPASWLAANLLIIGTHFACMLILRHTFRPFAAVSR